MGNENTQMYQVEVIILIKHQILITYLQGNVLQLEGRINNHILDFFSSEFQAYYRRASAYMALGKFKLSLKDYEMVGRYPE